MGVFIKQRVCGQVGYLSTRGFFESDPNKAVEYELQEAHAYINGLQSNHWGVLTTKDCAAAIKEWDGLGVWMKRGKAV